MKIEQFGNIKSNESVYTLKSDGSEQSESGNIDEMRLSALEGHATDTENPHGVTKHQVGLGNVKNQAITVTQNSVSDGTNTFSQFDPSTINGTLSQIQTNKQDKLVSGTNVKTVGGSSILGSGDISFKTINGASILGTGDITINGGGDGSRELSTEQRIDVISDSIDIETDQREAGDRQLSDRLDEIELQTQNFGNLANYSFQVLTQEEYDELEEPDSHTFYFVVGDESEGGGNEPEENGGNN